MPTNNINCLNPDRLPILTAKKGRTTECRKIISPNGVLDASPAYFYTYGQTRDLHTLADLKKAIENARGKGKCHAILGAFVGDESATALESVRLFEDENAGPYFEEGKLGRIYRRTTSIINDVARRVFVLDIDDVDSSEFDPSDPVPYVKKYLMDKIPLGEVWAETDFLLALSSSAGLSEKKESARTYIF